MSTAENRARGEAALALFERGANCAQAVFCAFADRLGLDEETACRMASGFGGGMGRQREVCGAFSAMVLAAGMLRGPSCYDDKAGKDACYADIQELGRRFRESEGTLICREILGLTPGVQETPVSADRNAAYTVHHARCYGCVRHAAEILAAFLEG